MIRSIVQASEQAWYQNIKYKQKERSKAIYVSLLVSIKMMFYCFSNDWSHQPYA